MSTETPPPESTTSPAARRSRSQSMVIALVLLIVGGPVLYSYGRRELAAWHLAAGYEYTLSQQREAALREIDKAIAYRPRDARLLMRRVSWKMRPDEIQGVLKDCDLALELARAAYGSSNTPQTLGQLAQALNQRAYAYALADEQLEKALEDAEQAIGMFGRDFNVLDTRGYLHLKLGHLEEAQSDLETAVKAAEADFKRSTMQIRQRRRSMVDTRPADQSERTLREALAVLTHHRGELYERLDRPEDAERDIQRALRMGYDPENGVW